MAARALDEVSNPLPRLEDDPEFRPVVGAVSRGDSPEARKYRRVIFNPFLGFAAVGLWAEGIRWAAGATEGWAPLLVFGFTWSGFGFWGAARCFRFHCLDCGRGGPAWKWRAHLCPRVTRRIHAGRPARFRPPGPLVQGVVWVHLLVGLVAFCWGRGPWSP